MKKINYMLLTMLLMFLLPSFVNAASTVDITVSCSNVNVGGSTTCTIRGTSNALSAIESNISLSGGATMTGITAGSGFTPLENTVSGNSGSFAYMTLDDKSGTFTIATINVNGVSAGAATLKISNINVGTDNATADNSIGTKQTTFSVIAPATQPTVPPTSPQTRPTTNLTQSPPTTSTTTNSTQNISTNVITTGFIANIEDINIQEIPGTPLVLSSVMVDDFDVTYQDGKYFATVNYDTESVEVNATADEQITIIGQGTRNLAVGKNVVELIVKNELNYSRAIQVVITRPEDTNEYDTTLSSLKVVGYNIDFNKDKKEYALTVDSSIKELYVIAESSNADVAIVGAGLKTLTKGENEIHIISQYGDKASTEYIIYIKRSYNKIIMYTTIGFLGTGLIGCIAYFLMDRKKLLNNSKQEKNKIIAEANRVVATSQENPSINGESTVGIGKTLATPIAAVVGTNPPTPAPKPTPIVVPQPAAIMQGSTQQIVETKVPTNPVTVAQSTVIPKKVDHQKINNNHQQVKVVKTNHNPQPVKTINPINTSTNYTNDQIVINTGK